MKAKKLLTTLAIVSVVLIAGCRKDDFVEVIGVCPNVESTSPANLATSVALDKVITVTFNKQMNPATITQTSFTVKQGTNSVAGIISYSGLVASFTPTSALIPNVIYTGTITTKVKDLIGNAIQTNYVWTFTTISQITLSSNPAIGGTTNGAGSFAIGAVVTVAATPLSGFTFTNWTDNGVTVSTSASYQFTMTGNKALIANFTPVISGNFAVVLSSSPIAGGTTSGAGSFSSGTTVTVTAFPYPLYSFFNWTDNGVIVSTSSSYQFILTGNKSLVANYKLIPASQFVVILSSNPLIGGTTIGSGSFSAASPVTVIATPNTGYSFINWMDGSTIVSTVSNYTFNINANRTLVANFALAAPIGPGLINLGTAATFTVISKSGISTTGVTSIAGDIGVSPSSASSITGFGLIMNTDGQSSHTPIVIGNVYAADYAPPTPTKMTTAVSDLESAFTTANGLTTTVIVDLYAGDISGRILPPGLYKWGTGVLISSAGVTLNGSVNDTWVFQIAQNLTVNNSAKITLTGGAQAKNIFWIVAGQATLGTGVDFSGNILSQTLISLNTGAKVTGRLLAQTAVTFNASTVVYPQ